MRNLCAYVVQEGAKFFARTSVHDPCKGGQHRGCVVQELQTSKPFDTEEEALEKLREIAAALDGGGFKRTLQD